MCLARVPTTVGALLPSPFWIVMLSGRGCHRHLNSPVNRTLFESGESLIVSDPFALGSIFS